MSLASYILQANTLEAMRKQLLPMLRGTSKEEIAHDSISPDLLEDLNPAVYSIGYLYILYEPLFLAYN